MIRGDTGIEVDLKAFRERAHQKGGDPSLCAVALGLYRGEFACSLDVDWVAEERQAIRSEYLGLLSRTVETCRRAALFDTALEFAQRLVLEEPFDERAHRSLLLVQIELGDRGAAVKHFEDLERTWQTELGVDPAPETRALIDHINEDPPVRMFSMEHLVSDSEEDEIEVLHRSLGIIRMNARRILQELCRMEDELRHLVQDDLP